MSRPVLFLALSRHTSSLNEFALLLFIIVASFIASLRNLDKFHPFVLRAKGGGPVTAGTFVKANVWTDF